jgi:hypothetical protein
MQLFYSQIVYGAFAIYSYHLNLKIVFVDMVDVTFQAAPKGPVIPLGKFINRLES